MKLKIPAKNHKPIRTCIVTKEKKPKNELIRLVLDREGKVQIDIKGKVRGRGANIVPDMQVLEKGFEIGAIRKALKLEAELDENDKARLRKDFQVAVEEKQFRPTNKPVKIRIRKQELEKKINSAL